MIKCCFSPISNVQTILLWVTLKYHVLCVVIELWEMKGRCVYENWMYENDVKIRSWKHELLNF
jgi:hypothetical protein